MRFNFEERATGSPFIETIWRNRSDSGGPFLSMAVSHWVMVVTRLQGRAYLTVRGPDTRPAPAICPPDAEHVGVFFKLGVVMPHLPAGNLVDGELNLPEAGSQSFWLQGSAWQYPDFDNIDTFVERLVRADLLVREPVVTTALQSTSGQAQSTRPLHDPPYALSVRSVQRRFLQTTGLTFKAIQQIERARHATALLKQGLPILDVVDLAGYADQPHLTRSLKRYIGQTPAQISGETAQTLSFLFKTNPG